MKTPLLVSPYPMATSEIEELADYLENMVVENDLPIKFAISYFFLDGEEFTKKSYDHVDIYGSRFYSTKSNVHTVSSALNLMRGVASEIKNGVMIPFFDLSEAKTKSVDWYRVRYEAYEADPTVAFIGEQMEALGSEYDVQTLFLRVRKYITFNQDDFNTACFFEGRPLMQENVFGLSINLKWFDLLGGFPEHCADIQVRALLMGYKFLPINT